MGKEIIFYIMYYLNFLCIIYSSFKLLSYLYHYLYLYMLYISYIINIFHTLCIICISYIFLFQAKIFPVQYLPLMLYNYYFPLQIPPRTLFSTCIITPVHFFDTLRLLIPLSPSCTITSSCIYSIFKN